MDTLEGSVPSITFDKLLKQLGGTSWYQFILFTILGAYSMWSVESIYVNFVAAELSHWCKVPELVKFPFDVQKNIAIPSDNVNDYASVMSFSECRMFNFNYSAYTTADFMSWNRSLMAESATPVPCKDGWTYDHTEFATTIISEWDLVCTQEWLVPLVSTTFGAGQFLGGITTGLLADKFGRLPVLVVCSLIKFASSLISAFAPNYTVLLVMKVISGFGNTGSYLVGFIMIMEVSSGLARTIFGVGYMVTFSVGYMMTPLFSQHVRDWRKIQIIMAGPTFIGAAFWWVLHESPRWLLVNRHFKEAEKVIKKIAKINGTELPEGLDISRIGMDDGAPKDLPKRTLLDIFRRPLMRKWAIISCLHWFTDSLVYYALSLNAGSLAGSVFLNTFLLGLVEIPANIIAALILEWPPMGRRRTASFSLLFAGGTALISVPLITTNAATALAILGKAGATMGFSTAYVYTGELFPTEIRNVAVGMCTACARSSAMVAPFVGGVLGNVWNGLPFLIYGIFGVVTGALALLLPETLNRGLFDTMEEAEHNLRKSHNNLNVETPSEMVIALPSSSETQSTVTQRKILSTSAQSNPAFVHL